MLKNESFIPQRFEEERAKDKRKVLTISLNMNELKELKSDMKLIRQDQIGKAIKQLMKLGQIVLHEQKTTKIIDTLFINEKNLERRGITLE